VKSWPPYFVDVARGTKRFEVRLNDRDYHVGDYLRLREFDPERREYSGRMVTLPVEYVMPLEPIGVQGGYVALGLGAARL
jgi:hypothetical protein